MVSDTVDLIAVAIVIRMLPDFEIAEYASVCRDSSLHSWGQSACRGRLFRHEDQEQREKERQAHAEECTPSCRGVLRVSSLYLSSPVARVP